jgi:4-alpha-glucanotransferase
MPPTTVSFSSSPTYEDALNRAADLWGIERDYWDIWGQRHFAPQEGIQAVLASLGVANGSLEQLDRAIESHLWAEWSHLLPPTVVVAASAPDVIVRLPQESRDADGELSIRWESGDMDRTRIRFDTLEEVESASLRGRDFAALRLRLPFPARLGYHELKIGVSGRSSETAITRLILCPDRAYCPEDLAGSGRAGGIAVSLYGLRSDRNWGCGDFTDLMVFIDWAVTRLGASFVALNPLHALANRQPYNTSPYLPLCAFFKNCIYLDVTAIPDFDRSPCARRLAAGASVQRKIAALRSSEHVEYEQVHRLKTHFLKILFRTFLKEYRQKTRRAEEFREYVEREGPLLDEFAIFCALDEVLHKRDRGVWVWPQWPAEYQRPHSPETRAFAVEHWRTVLFYKYVQWQLDLQLGEAQAHAKKAGMSIGLYHDLALATDRFGGDLWAHRRFYVAGCRVGAPPDDFSPNGQDWSFPPPNAVEHFKDGYRLFSESIRHNLRHGGALRIDHVMRFFHLFWIPDGLDARRGIYVRDCHRDLIPILALESVRNRVIVIGEDLGTVADEIRETLHRFGILSYRLFYFERDRDGAFKWPDQYPKEALVSAATHDLPTLAGFWRNRDIEARRAVGVLSEDGYRAQLADRAEEKQKMLNLLFRLGFLPPHYPREAASVPDLDGDLHNAVVGFLASTPSCLMLLNQEDLTKDNDQQNLPGTTAEYPNWRHKTRFTVEEFLASPACRGFSDMYRSWLERTGRLNR